MDSYLADVTGSPKPHESKVIHVQYQGAVFDTTIRIKAGADLRSLEQSARALASIPEETDITLLRLDYKGEIVSHPQDLLPEELLEMREGAKDDAHVLARQAELQQFGHGSKKKADSVKNTIKFLHIVENLKRTKRTGWLNHGIKPAESIADHMYRMGIMALLIDEKTAGVNKDRCLKIAIVHDLAESLVGDITPFDGVSIEDKHARERNAMHHLCHDLLEWSEQAQEISALWEEYEAALTPEALLVKDFDKFEMILQSDEYTKSEGVDLSEFWEAKKKIKHPMVTSWVRELEQERMESRTIHD